MSPETSGPQVGSGLDSASGPTNGGSANDRTPGLNCAGNDIVAVTHLAIYQETGTAILVAAPGVRVDFPGERKALKWLPKALLVQVIAEVGQHAALGTRQQTYTIWLPMYLAEKHGWPYGHCDPVKAEEVERLNEHLKAKLDHDIGLRGG